MKDENWSSWRFGEVPTIWRKTHDLEKVPRFGEKPTIWRKFHDLEKGLEKFPRFGEILTQHSKVKESNVSRVDVNVRLFVIVVILHLETVKTKHICDQLFYSVDDRSGESRQCS